MRTQGSSGGKQRDAVRRRAAARQWPRRLGVVGLALWLVACGPGVGGTGTGPRNEELQAFGAEPAALCLAAFADRLQCPAGPGAGPTPPFNGAARSVFVDAETGGQTHVEFLANEIEFDARCQRLRFSGTWGVAADGQARFYGSVAGDGFAAPVLAQLVVTAATAPSRGLVLLLQAADGTVIAGPLQVQPAPDPPPAPTACP
jgi:hypothetical protein